MLCDTTNKIIKSVTKKVPSRVLFQSNNEDETMDEEIENVCYNPCHFQGRPPMTLDIDTDIDIDSNSCKIRHIDALDRDALGANASIPFATIQSSGPPSRPLEFPAPTVDRGITVAADIIDHRTGNIFLAKSVLMRRPIHSKNCVSRAPPAKNCSGSFDSTTRSLGRTRAKFPDRIHSWQPAFNSPSSSLATDTSQEKPPHRRVNSLSLNTQQLPPCDHACDVPDKAYCIRKTICNTTYGSIRLCVVLKRVSQNIVNYARAISEEENGYHSLPHHRIRDAERVPTWETTDEMVAIKVVSWSKLQSLRGRHLEDPIKELAALQQLLGKTHPNITSISDALQNETHLFYVYPYIAGGDLYGSLLDKMATSPTGQIDEYLARTWFRQILSAVNYLQKKGVCHRDLCLENMMVDQQDNIHIIDFGLCLRVPFADPDNRSFATDVSANTCRRLMKTQGQCGRLQYMAPEISMRSDAFDGFAIDLWAVGIVLFEMLIGKKPFTMPDPVDQNFQTISVEGNLAGLLRAKGMELNHKATDLLQGMLWCDPAKRLTLAQIVNHPWVEGTSKKSVRSVEEDGLDASWFIKNKSIDDIDGTKSAHSFLVEILNTPSTKNDSDASTSVSSCAASQNPLSPQTSSDHSSDHSLDQYSDPKPSVDLQGDEKIDGPNESNAQKKRNRLTICLKNMKWRRTGKTASTQLPSNCERP